jgi:HPt (histidine-containing phosphotransfer) domain-containing protein
MLVTVTLQFPRQQMSSNDEQLAQRVIRAFLASQGKFSEQITQIAMAAAK